MKDIGDGLLIYDGSKECIFCKAQFHNAIAGFETAPHPAIVDGIPILICRRHITMYQQKWYRGVRGQMKRIAQRYGREQNSSDL